MHLRGLQATDEVKAEWTRAYRIFTAAEGDRYDTKKDRTLKLMMVMQVMGITRKQAKRRVRHFTQWQQNLRKGLLPK